jgi:hypothetical protein
MKEEARSGHPSAMHTDKMTEAVCHLLTDDCHTSLQMTAECLNISKDTAHTKDEQDFGNGKVCIMMQQKEEWTASCHTSFNGRG